MAAGACESGLWGPADLKCRLHSGRIESHVRRPNDSSFIYSKKRKKKEKDKLLIQVHLHYNAIVQAVFYFWQKS